MLESIHKVPLLEAFSHKDGCPICRIYDRYEKNAIEILLEEGVMDYNVRQATNEKGFCDRHLEMLSSGKDSLSVALAFSTYLEQRADAIKNAKSGGALEKVYAEITSGCYLCEMLDKQLRDCVRFASIFYAEDEFAKLFSEQEYFCARHTKLLLENVKTPSKFKKRYVEDIRKINLAYAKKTLEELKAYSTSYDYRNSNLDVNEVKNCNIHAKNLLK